MSAASAAAGKPVGTCTPGRPTATPAATCSVSSAYPSSCEAIYVVCAASSRPHMLTYKSYKLPLKGAGPSVLACPPPIRTEVCG